MRASSTAQWQRRVRPVRESAQPSRRRISRPAATAAAGMPKRTGNRVMTRAGMVAALAALGACTSSSGPPGLWRPAGRGLELRRLRRKLAWWIERGLQRGGQQRLADRGRRRTSVGDDGGSGTTGSSSGGGVMLEASGWTCAFDTVFGGYTMAWASCVEAMCTSQVTACISRTCANCEGPVFTCLSASCASTCAAGTGSSSGGASGGGSSAGACASLSSCCPLLAVVGAQYASQCTMTASGGNDGSCQNFVAAVNSVAPGVCP